MYRISVCSKPTLSRPVSDTHYDTQYSGILTHINVLICCGKWLVSNLLEIISVRHFSCKDGTVKRKWRMKVRN